MKNLFFLALVKFMVTQIIRICLQKKHTTEMLIHLGRDLAMTKAKELGRHYVMYSKNILIVP